jgi:hypothetical protein
LLALGLLNGMTRNHGANLTTFEFTTSVAVG